MGIEDPLRPEVEDAIRKCNAAGVDVRMVTGDNLDTAVEIAKRAGILKDDCFEVDPEGKVNVLKGYAMEGSEFRALTHDDDGDKEKAFNQAKFDLVWPKLRVLARSSPHDKYILAHGLNR